MLIGFALNGIA
jgi:hypothetical protein